MIRHAVLSVPLIFLTALPLAAQDSVLLPARGGMREYVRGPVPAKARRSAQPAVPEWTIYPSGREQTEYTRRVLRGGVALRLAPGADPAALAPRHGLRDAGRAAGPPEQSGWHLYDAGTPEALVNALPGLQTDAAVLDVSPLLYRQQRRRFAPNDPYFSQQWHLLNTGQGGGLAGADVNVTPVWDSWKGAGVRIAIVDDGLQLSHPDLSANVDTVNDHDWNDATPNDPSPSVSLDYHGTSCAGVAAARGNNGTGVSGAAPEATLVGLRLISEIVSDAEEAEALTWRSDLISISSNSWGPDDDGRTLEEPGPVTRAALASAAATGRGGKGTIFFWAGGNGRAVNDDSNYDGYANSIYTIAVGAVSNTGGRASYAEPGANLVISAPSDGGTEAIVTTDLKGTFGYNSGALSGELSDSDYTNDFGGTSSAAPLAAGCAALLLQSNPSLGWRDVQEILIRSATKVSPSSAEWVTNGAGIPFNHDFGAGLLNVQAAVALAAAWQNLPAATTATAAESGLSVNIPDNTTAGIVRTFDLSDSSLRVEHVTVTVDIRHTRRGQLAVTLTSPSGTESRLARVHNDTGANYSNWTFSTVRSWGESSQGTWVLRVSDGTTGTTGTYRAATLTVHGTPAGPVDHPPVITAAALSPDATAWSDTTLAVSGVAAADPDGDTVTWGTRWETSPDGVNWSTVAGAAGNSLTLSEVMSGRLVRAVLTPLAGGLSGEEFATAGTAILRRPLQWAQRGAAWSYDSDLFLTGGQSSLTRDAVLHEFSQGAAGTTNEWVEILLVQTTDLRGWSLSDRSGVYVTFTEDPLWEAVPAGTLLVIFRGSSVDPALPPVDTDPADFRLVVAHSDTTLFSGNAWSGLSNSGTESLILRRADGGIADALSFNADNVHDPKLGTVGSDSGAQFTGGDEAAVDLVSGWTIGSQSASTPGAVNGAPGSPDALWVAALRDGSLTQMPEFRDGTGNTLTGPVLDAASGVLSGVVTAASGPQQVVIERFVPGGAVVRQEFTVYVYDPAAPDEFRGLAFGQPGSLPEPVFSGAQVSADFTVPGGFSGAGAPVYQLELSPDLLSWTATAAPVSGVPDGQDLRVLHLSAPVTGTRKFARIRVSVP